MLSTWQVRVRHQAAITIAIAIATHLHPSLHPNVRLAAADRFKLAKNLSRCIAVSLRYRNAAVRPPAPSPPTASADHFSPSPTRFQRALAASEALSILLGAYYLFLIDNAQTRRPPLPPAPTHTLRLLQASQLRSQRPLDAHRELPSPLPPPAPTPAPPSRRLHALSESAGRLLVY
ncbi:hypothetical protein M422DRAFT_784106 [Sphaerobolus stellatus SS14]|uniref:Uncharacterized protein n=1 Tax=Sphaerobolus stellatus (strain SS14) TaxID=990650 RepID=A0A0C9UXH5_SPHS4|nr:hypothetical protein M422DRAFT_784106 [Sphaerobolus stellatus SS14]